MASRIIGVSLHLNDDQDIIGWVDSLPARKLSETVRAAIRDYMEGETERQMLRTCVEILKRLDGRNFVAAIDSGGTVVYTEDLDSETMENLKGLGT